MKHLITNAAPCWRHDTEWLCCGVWKHILISETSSSYRFQLVATVLIPIHSGPCIWTGQLLLNNTRESQRLPSTSLEKFFILLACRCGFVYRGGMSTGISVVWRGVMGGSIGAFDSIRTNFLQQLIDVSRHRQSDVTLIPVDIDVHAQILSALSVHFYLI